MAAAEPRPGVLLCASAIGYYGDTGSRAVDESAPAGDGIPGRAGPRLGGGGRAGHAGRHPGRELPLRPRALPGGGLLGQLLLPFRLGLGARIGSGQQYMSWISLRRRGSRDQVPARAGRRAGRVQPDRSRAGHQRRLHQDAGARAAPAGAAHGARRSRSSTALGEVSGELLGSARVLPGRLQAAGFSFAHPDLATALARGRCALSGAARRGLSARARRVARSVLRSALALISLASGVPTVGPNSGICHSGGTRPVRPSYRMIWPIVSRSSRLAIAIASTASGSSTTSSRQQAGEESRRIDVEDDVEPGVAEQQRRQHDQRDDQQLAAPPGGPAGRRERDQQRDVEADPGATPACPSGRTSAASPQVRRSTPPGRCRRRR